MRALILMTIVLTSFGLYPSLAQEQPKPAAGASQPAQAQGDANASAKPDSQPNEADNNRRVMERMGPGMDWDHRKPGRDLQIFLRRENGGATSQQD